MTAELASDARAELAALVPHRRCDRLAELSALFHTAGAVHLLGRGALSFHLDLSESAVARRAYSILKELRIASEIRTYHRTAFDRAARTQLLVDGSAHAIDVLAQAGVLGDAGLPLDRPPGKVVARPCCRSAYLRGAFLGSGSLSGPASPHLEIRTPLHGGAAFVRSVASAAGVRLRVADRGSHSIAYAKSWEAIEALPGHRRGVRHRALARGAGPRRGASRGGEPPRERGSCEPRPSEPLRPDAARRGTPARGGRRPRSARPGDCRQPPSSVGAIRRSPLASSHRALTRRSRRPQWLRGSAASSRWRKRRRPTTRVRVEARATQDPYSPRWARAPGRRNQTPSTVRYRSALVREGVSSEPLPQPTAGLFLVRKADFAEAKSAARIPDLRAGQTPKGARCRGRNYTFDLSGLPRLACSREAHSRRPVESADHPPPQSGRYGSCGREA